MAGNGTGSGGDRDNPDNGIRGLMRGLRDFVTQIADPTATPRPQPISKPGRRPPRENPRAVTANSAGAREPLVDIYDEGDFIRVVADMPGADPATLKVRGVDDRLTIVASGPARRYERLIILPVPVHPERAEPPTFINGIMEILLPAERPAPPEEPAAAMPSEAITDTPIDLPEGTPPPAATSEPTRQQTMTEER
jgi:HSP20 family molecular chaperone IbpA